MRRSPRLAALALLLAALTPSLGACVNDVPAVAPDARSPTIRPHLQGGDDAVLVLGDSLTNGARLFGDLGDRLDRAGFDALTIIAEDSQDTGWGIEQVEALDQVPSVVVVELGTNPGPDPEGYEDLVVELVESLRSRGAERIAWLTPVYADDDRYDEKVAVLETVVGIDVVADWASVAQDDPDRLAADGLHPTRAGYADLAAFIVDTAVDVAAD